MYAILVDKLTAKRAQRAGTATHLALHVRKSSAARCLSGAAVSFWRDNALGMAGMIAFFAFLALIPLAILLLAFVGNVLGGQISANDVRNLFHNAVPGLSQHQFLTTYWTPIQHSKATTRILGVVSLFVGSMGLHDSVDWAVNQIWRSGAGRPFWVAKLRGLGVIVWVVMFAVSSLWLTWLWTQFSGAVHAPGFLAAALITLLPSLILDIGIFGMLYKLTPTVRVNTRCAFLAAALAASLWELSKIGFGWWVVEVGTYNRVYGPLAATVIVMLWIWITAIIFLYGVELAAVMQRYRWPL